MGGRAGEGWERAGRSRNTTEKEGLADDEKDRDEEEEEEQEGDVEYKAGHEQEETHSSLFLLKGRCVFLHLVAALGRFLFRCAGLLFVIFLAPRFCPCWGPVSYGQDVVRDVVGAWRSPRLGVLDGQFGV